MMDSKGFTLIEIITVIIVLGILGGFGLSFLMSNSRTYQIMKVQRELYQDGTYIMERISRDIRDSRGYGLEKCPTGFMRAHPSIDTNLCTQYAWDPSNGILTRSGQVIGRFVTNFQLTTESPHVVSLKLSRECGMPRNRDGTIPNCTVSLSTSVLPMNSAGKYDGDYEEVTY